MKHLFFLTTLLAISLQSCTATKAMTYSDFQAIPIGENISMIQVAEGRPYQVNEVANGNEEYIYMERIDIGGNRELFREYVFVVTKEGKLIEKKVRESMSPSLHLQLQ